MKNMCSNARFSSEIAPDFTVPIEYSIESFEQPPEEVLEEISLCILWTILLPLLQRHTHLQMQMIGKKLFVVRWTRFFLMELRSYLSYLLVVN
jgi:hypothetical protein